jgi:hypothetical protein
MCSTSSRIRGRNQILWKAEWFSRRVCRIASQWLETNKTKMLDTHNFIISTTRVISPGSFLHHLFGHRLKVHQIVALFQNRHHFHPLHPLNLIRILGLLLLLYSLHVHFAQVLALIEELVQSVGRVDGLVLFRSVLASVLEDDFGAAGMLGHEFCYVVCCEVRDVSRRSCHAIECLKDMPLPWTMTQQSSLVTCFATSSPVSLTFCVSLLSRFIVAVAYVSK